MTSPAALGAVLGADAVVIAARDLIAAELRTQQARVDGTWGGERALAESDSQRAAQKLATAAREAAEAYARKEIQPCPSR